MAQPLGLPDSSVRCINHIINVSGLSSYQVWFTVTVIRTLLVMVTVVLAELLCAKLHGFLRQFYFII